jgi:hypothetical protein
MRQSGREDRNLSEVRSLLDRLQGLPAERQSAGPRLAELGFRRGYLIGIASTTTVMVTAALVLVFGYVLPGAGPPATSTPKQATSTPKDDPNRQVASLKVPDASGVPTGPAVTPKDDPNRQTASLKLPDAKLPDAKLPQAKLPDASGVFTGSAVSTEEQQGASAKVNPAVEAAQALMSAGRVQAARERLLAMAPDGSPHVAWALARSYDPNHLKEIQGADAAPDVAEATRWYRTWYAAAVKQRMISDSVSVEKIIGSMRP